MILSEISKNFLISTDNCIIIHPDILITGTTLAESHSCMRKSTLNHKFKVTSMVVTKNNNKIKGRWYY